ncbi:MAG: peptidoglycan-binding protein [Oscillospiraceae bacterium]|nr:peptidoglycan-binding protein [Oscillospiraceae bacterium]
MAKIFVYDTVQNTLQTFYRQESEFMPYNTNGTMRVREFRGSSNSSVLWTTRQAMEAWNRTRASYGSPIPFRYAFKRIWEGGHGLMSQHYAGTSFDVGQALTATQRRNIYNVARNSGLWGYVEPLSLTPTWVHFDRRYGRPACSTGYNTLRLNSRGCYVLILQDCLNTLGYSTAGLDGRFGPATYRAVQNFQGDYNLTRDGIVGCSTWEKLCSRVKGNGSSSTTVDP